MNKYFILLAVFFVAGCGEATYWAKFGGSPDEFDRTQMACHNRTYFLPQTKHEGSEPDYQMKTQIIENDAYPIIATYKVPYQNLSDAFGSLVATFEDIARKELLFENCMVANGWKRLSVSAVALREPVFAKVGPQSIMYEGIATGYLDSTGTMKMKNSSGNVCVGSLRYTTNWTGDGSMRCDDGDSARFEFQGISGFSGYGTGTTRKGNQIKFVYGVEEEEIHQYLK
jgi:hypothetical protein